MISDRVVVDRAWHLVGHRSELSNPGDWVCHDIGQDVELAAWIDVDGSPFVFDNLCPHRGFRILRQGRGNGPMVCGYHGWCRRGGEDHWPEGLARARPRRFTADWCGDFLFAAGSPRRSLQDFLGAPVAAELAGWSAAIGPHHRQSAQRWLAPWRVAVENALEPIHIPLVHRETLWQLGISADAEEFRTFEGGHSLYGAAVGNKLQLERLSALPFARRSDAFDGCYLALYLFPFAMISTTGGLAFSIQRYAPKGRRTGFSTSTYAGWATKATAAGVAYMDIHHAASEAIFSEDREVVERTRTVYSRPLGEREVQVAHFRRELARYFSGT